MREVMISIKPKWCELIASGKKTVEVRKTKPKLETPFKVYIYCTKGRGDCLWHWNGVWYDTQDPNHRPNRLDGKVIGEFVCNEIENLTERDLFDGMDEISNSRIENYSCVDIDELLRYKGSKNEIYGWHITDLVVYDEPRELWEFKTICKEYGSDNPNCTECHYCIDGMCYEYDESDCGCNGRKPITRAPQSWQFCVATEPRQTAD